ncbi:hypothetical protein OnM2_02321 [Erysiphe neolycopersici]|uniref:Uncharacterized protein n=1 Tax=Erysiphe neolycopersici TaxID=212602 RepID=A0A420HZ02_9PEZI|nr:hypothetical protein OnM2_02321 [Erysiphe neolycopersici]
MPKPRFYFLFVFFIHWANLSRVHPNIITPSISRDNLHLKMASLSQSLDIDMEGAGVNPLSGLSAEDVRSLSGQVCLFLAEQSSKRQQEPLIAIVPKVQNPPSHIA